MTVGLDGFTLLAIPFFVLAGNIMNTGGIARRLVNLAQALVGRLPGSLAHCNILANTLFGAISGSAVASAAAVGGIMSPLQEKRDMIRRFQQRLILPLHHWPDDPTEQCVDCLFPRQWRDFCRCVVLSWISAGHPHRCCLNVCSCTLCRRHHYPVAERINFRQFLQVFRESIPSLMLIFIIIGGIIAGVFTPTEASAIAVIYSLALAMIYREITLKAQ